MKKLILIVGMHRSGTSLLSRAMSIFGAKHGENLLGQTPGNKKGHWEDKDIMALNIEILFRLGKDWDTIAPISQEDLQKLHDWGLLQRAVALLQDKFANIEVLALKEPRITRLLAFWKQVFSVLNIDIKYVFAFRHPYTVAQSLHKRNNFPLEKGMLLWFSYNIFALEELNNKALCFIDYDSFLKTPERFIQQLEPFVGETIIPHEKNLFLNEFLDINLRSFTTNDTPENFPHIYNEFYNYLLSFQSELQYSSKDCKKYIYYFTKIFNK